MKRSLTIAAVALAMGVSAGCTTSSSPSDSSSPQDSGGDDSPIVIGAAVAESGFLTAFDGPSYAGFKVLVDQVNADGGVDGRQIQLIARDTASTTQGSKDAATGLIEDGAQIILTNANFDFASPAANVAQAANILNVSLGAAAPNYGVQGIGPQAYSPAPATYLEGAAMAQFAQDQGWSKPFLLTDDSIDYGTQVGVGAADRLEALGVSPAGEATFKNDDTSIASQITELKGSGADAVLLNSYLPGAATAIRQLRADGVDLPIVSNLGSGGTDWVSATPGLSDFYNVNLASIYGDDPNPDVQEFVQAFTDATGEAPATSQALEGYAAGQLIVHAIEEAGGSTDGPALSEQLDALSDFETLIGPITFTPEVHIKAQGPLTILRYTDGTPAYFDTIEDVGDVDLHLD